MSEPNEIEASAREMGWKPLEEFKGDPEKWVAADEFLRRGENFLPILRKTNKELKEKLDAQSREVAELKELLKASGDAIEALKEYQSTETRRQVENARKELLEKLKTAREEGDVEAEEQVREQLREANEALREAPKAKAEPPAPAPAKPDQPHPDFADWVKDNSWFNESARKRALAIGIAEELRADPKNAKLEGRAFFDKVTEELESFLGESITPKVDGGRPTGSRGGSSRVRGYGDLPAEARADLSPEPQ